MKRLAFLLIASRCLIAQTSPCDLNADGSVNVVDVQLAINQSIHAAACTNANLLNDGCTQADVNIVVNAVLGLGCAVTRGGGTGTDSVTIFEADGVNQSGRPITFGRAFVQGEFAQCLQPVVGGAAIANYQVDVKNRWPDSSVKFAVVSLIAPTLTANGNMTVTFQANSSCNNSGYLTQSQMLAFNSGNWGAELDVSAGGTTIKTNAATMLGQTDPASNTFGDCKNDYWLQGPVVTAVIVQDCTPATASDFGWTWNGSTMSGSVTGNCGGAAHCAASLHPWFILYFFPGSNAARADMILENDWVDRWQDQMINVNYLTGSPPMSQLNYAGTPRKLTDLVSTANSDVVTSASANWQASDVGASISIGTLLDTTICSVQSATQATLCAPPAAGGSGQTAYINKWIAGQNYRKTFWTGSGNPGNVLIDHNWTYLVSTGMVPRYDTTKSASPDSAVIRASDNCEITNGTDFTCFAQYSLLNSGFTQTWSDIGERGGHGRLDQQYSQFDGDPTPMSRQALLYLTNMGTCGTANGACAKAWYILTGTRGARDSSLPASVTGGAGIWGNSGNIPYHNRESRAGTVDTASYYCATLAGKNTLSNSGTCGTTNSPFGRPFSKYFNWSSGLPAGSPTGSVYSAGGWNPDAIRWLEWTYNAWLMTGDYYFTLDLQMNAAWAITLYNNSHADYGSYGFFAVANPKGSILRQTAGVTDAMIKAWAASPDASLEQTYWDSILASNAETFEGLMNIQNGVGGYTSALTPTSPNTTCSSYSIASVDRWSWGNCTLRSLCGAGEPQSASCTPITQQLHTPVSGQNITGLTANVGAGIFTVGYAVAGSTTELVNWDASGVTPAVGTKITILNATGAWTALNGVHTVSATGRETGTPCTSAPSGITSCDYIIIDANTIGKSQPMTGSVFASWESFGLVSSATAGSTTTISTSNFASDFRVDIYGCVDQAGTNWSGLNGVWTPTMVSSTSFSVPFNSTGFPPFSQSGCYWTTLLANDKTVDQVQGWMEGLWGVVANEAGGLGITHYRNVAAELNKRLIEKIEDPGYNPFLIAKNLLPIKGPVGGATLTSGDGTANPLYSTWAAVKAALPPYTQALATFWPAEMFIADIGSNPCTDHAYALINRAHAAYLPGLTSGSLSGTAAWSWVNANVPFFNNSPASGDAGCGSSDQQIKFALAPP